MKGEYIYIRGKTRGKIIADFAPIELSVCESPFVVLNKTTDVIKRQYPINHKENILDYNWWNKLLKATPCDICNRTLTYTLYKEKVETEANKYKVTEGLRLDEFFNFHVSTERGL
jgi:hypothetical protein